jgi:hypothetical protein
LLYENGYGVTQDYGQARQWYQKALDAGNPDAKYLLSRQISTLPAALTEQALADAIEFARLRRAKTQIAAELTRLTGPYYSIKVDQFFRYQHLFDRY